MNGADVEIRVTRGIGRITLNRPRALNALTHAMEVEIDAALVRWASDPEVGLVLVDGRGERGFCAGGDIRDLYEAARVGKTTLAAAYFADEYRMNARIANYPKPYVAFMDGIVMGGGVGISAHGSHRIVTEQTMLAMPEVGIGFIPDIGGSFLLGHMPGETGLHVAIAACRMSGADAIFGGVADYYVESTRLPELADALAGAHGHEKVAARIKTFASSPPVSALDAAQSWIDECYSKPTAEEIVAALASHESEAAREAAVAIGRVSPGSVKITLQLVRKARQDFRLEPALDREYRVGVRRAGDNDFIEGVRAQLVDKDRNPRWSPATLADVDDASIDAYFASLGEMELGLTPVNA